MGAWDSWSPGRTLATCALRSAAPGTNIPVVSLPACAPVLVITNSRVDCGPPRHHARHRTRIPPCSPTVVPARRQSPAPARRHAPPHPPVVTLPRTRPPTVVLTHPPTVASARRSLTPARGSFEPACLRFPILHLTMSHLDDDGGWQDVGTIRGGRGGAGRGG